ncbi:diguanylate cyclase [Aneurinibacillus sp. BA2021]|nr:diguanylate cyclase [Aneurinibacillus sp. BA2021]
MNIYIAEATELEAALAFAGEVIGRAFGAGVCVSLIEEEEQNLQVWLDTDREESRYCYVLAPGTTENQVLETKKLTVVYPGRGPVPFTFLPLQSYGTVCLLPIYYKEQRQGILHVFHPQEIAVEPYVLEFLEGVSIRLGIAVHNWQQQQDLLYKRRKLQLLFDMMEQAVDVDKGLDDVLAFAQHEIAHTFDCSRVRIGLLDEQKKKITFSYRGEEKEAEWAESLILPPAPGQDRRHEEAFRTGLPVVIEDAQHDDRCGEAARLLGLTSGAAVPIMYKDEPLGIIYTDHCDYRHLADMQLAFLIAIARQLGTIIMNVRQYEHIKTLAITDGLTGLHTRQYFAERYAEEHARAMRYNSPLCLIMIDIDDFKKINDTYGHIIGDQVLEAVARMLQKQVRAYDIVARYGGEELILLLPRTHLEDALGIAERIQQSFHTLAFPFTITASIGLASYPEHAVDREELLMRADDAMYRAKHQGKDRIKIARALSG